MATHRPGYRAPWMDRSYVDADHAGAAQRRPTAPAASSRWRASAAGRRRVDARSCAAAKGNPFFLEELARTVVEHGRGTDVDSRRRCRASSWRALDRLPDVAEAAAADGVGARTRGAARAAGARVERRRDFDAELAELCRHEFLYERPAATSRSYVFKHALTQDVAYDSLLARSRRELHLRAARALEELYADRLDEIDGDARLSLRAHRSRRRSGDMADARGGSGRARLRERRSDPASRSGRRAGCSGCPKAAIAIDGCSTSRCGTRIRSISSADSARASTCCCRTRRAWRDWTMRRSRPPARSGSRTCTAASAISAAPPTARIAPSRRRRAPATTPPRQGARPARRSRATGPAIPQRASRTARKPCACCEMHPRSAMVARHGALLPRR